MLLCNARAMFVAGALAALLQPPAAAEPLARHAIAFRAQLAQRVLPWWYDNTIDRKNGGFLLSADATHAVPPGSTKQLVTQARMIWGFSHAVLEGY